MEQSFRRCDPEVGLRRLRQEQGQQASLGLEHTWFVGQRFMFTPSATLTWLDRKYADYYYGVRSTEARADRPAYFADSTMNAEFELRTDYLIDPKQMLFVSLGYTALGSEIKDSPLTDRSGRRWYSSVICIAFAEIACMNCPVR